MASIGPASPPMAPSKEIEQKKERHGRSVGRGPGADEHTFGSATRRWPWLTAPGSSGIYHVQLRPVVFLISELAGQLSGVEPSVPPSGSGLIVFHVPFIYCLLLSCFKHPSPVSVSVPLCFGAVRKSCYYPSLHSTSCTPGA